jgi:hypothetical protein
MVERAKQESCRTELVRFVQEAICNRKGLRIVRLSDGIEAAKDAIAAVMSSWTDRDMLVGGRLFPAGSITVVDVLDHAAFAASQTALEASHHAELVEALRSIEQEADQAQRLLSEDTDVEAALCTIASIAGRTLAKINFPAPEVREDR